MPFSPAQWYCGLGRQSAAGTGVVPASTGWLPVEPPDITPNITLLEDKGNRGSMVDVYNLVQGVGFGEIGLKGLVYMDSFPHLARAILGNIDVVNGVAVGGGSAFSTTLSAGAAAGATSISTVGQPTVGQALQIEASSSNVREVRTVTAVSGSGPYSSTVAALSFAHLSGVAVTSVASPWAHNFTLLNNSAATANQTPLYSISVFRGLNTRRMIDAVCASLTVRWSTEGLLEWEGKFVGQLPTVVTDPTSAFSTALPTAGWRAVPLIAGAGSTTMMSGEVTLERDVKPIYGGTGLQSPLDIFGGALKAEGKASFIYETDTELNYYLNNTQPTMQWTLTQAADAELVAFFNQVAFRNGKVTAGSPFSQYDADFTAIPNTTDAYAGGVSPLRLRLTNAVQAQY
jgi:hypothetical protein